MGMRAPGLASARDRQRLPTCCLGQHSPLPLWTCSGPPDLGLECVHHASSIKPRGHAARRCKRAQGRAAMEADAGKFLVGLQRAPEIQDYGAHGAHLRVFCFLYFLYFPLFSWRPSWPETWAFSPFPVTMPQKAPTIKLCVFPSSVFGHLLVIHFLVRPPRPLFRLVSSRK